MATFQPSHSNPTEAHAAATGILDRIRRQAIRATATAKRRQSAPARNEDFDFEAWKAQNEAYAAQGLTPAGLPPSGEVSTGGKMTRPTDDPLDLMVVDIEEESGRGLMGYLPWVLGGVAVLGLGVYFVRRR